MSLKSRVLVLNFSYEPLHTISIEDAFTNYFNGKYYIEEYEKDRVYRSPKAEWKVPSVVRLKEYKSVRKRKRDSATKRTRIYIRDKYCCSYCGKKGKDKELTLDHIIPKSKKNEFPDAVINSPQNLVTCCLSCNQKKGDKSLDECGMTLLHPEKHLNIGLDKVVMNHYGNVKPEWGKYLFFSGEGDQSCYE